MNATSTSPNPNEYEDLAWLLPEPAESDLPSDRYLHIQEFVMSQILQDLPSTAQRPRRAPRRRVAYLASALTAAVAIAGVSVAVGGIGGTKTSRALPGASSTEAVSYLSGQQVLLAAATTAETLPNGAGSYWHLKVSADSDGKPFAWETWNSRDGQTWFRGEKSGGSVVKLELSNPFVLGGAKVSFARIQDLPADPAALKASIEHIISTGDVRTSGGKLTATQQEQAVFESLVSLVSQLPAPQNVRAAAFRAIADYPNVTSLGQVDGGLGLLISFANRSPARLVIDPASAQVRRTNFYVSADGALVSAAEGDGFTLTSEWTDTLPE